VEEGEEASTPYSFAERLKNSFRRIRKGGRIAFLPSFLRRLSGGEKREKGERHLVGRGEGGEERSLSFFSSCPAGRGEAVSPEGKEQGGSYTSLSYLRGEKQGEEVLAKRGRRGGGGEDLSINLR